MAGALHIPHQDFKAFLAQIGDSVLASDDLILVAKCMRLCRGVAYAKSRSSPNFRDSSPRTKTAFSHRNDMKILFISQYFHPEPFSNTQLAAELVKRGHEIVAVPCVPNYPKGRFYDSYSNNSRRDEEHKGVAIRRAWTIPRGSSKATLLLNYLTYPIAAISRIRRMPNDTADVAFVSMPSPLTQAFVGAWLKRSRGVPIVYWVQDLWPETVQQMFGLKNGLFLKALTAMCRWLYRQADIILVQSEAMPRLIERHGIAPGRIRVLPNTAPAHFIPLPQTSKSELAAGIPEASFIVMFAGNFGESQGLEILAEAAARITARKDIQFVMLGSGRGEEAFRERIAKLGVADSFHLLGRYGETEMPKFYAHADVLFLSLRDLPTFSLTVPYKLQTYMACGKPIVASLAGEARRIIEESGAGICADPGDAEALANALLELADMSADELDAMGRNARAYFEDHFSNTVIHGTLEKALVDAVGK